LKNLLKIISLVLLSSLSLCSCATEVKDFDYKNYSIIDQTIILHRDFVIDYNNTKENYSQNKDVRSCDVKSNVDNLTKTINFFLCKGLKKFQVHAMAANFMRESMNGKKKLLIDPHNSNGSQYGIAQWTGTRKSLFQKKFGHSLNKSSLTEQLEFVMYEFEHGSSLEKLAYKKILSSNDFDTASRAFVTLYERSANQTADIKKNRKLYKQYILVQ